PRSWRTRPQTEPPPESLLKFSDSGASPAGTAGARRQLQAAMTAMPASTHILIETLSHFMVFWDLQPDKEDRRRNTSLPAANEHVMPAWIAGNGTVTLRDFRRLPVLCAPQ